MANKLRVHNLHVELDVNETINLTLDDTNVDRSPMTLILLIAVKYC